MRLIEIPAVEFYQGKESKHHLYCFDVDGKNISDFATVDRVRRNGDSSLLGYQRHEVINHIKEIRSYLEESPNPMIPNAIVIAFDKSVRFQPLGGVTKGTVGRLGILRIQTPDDPEEMKPGWIVDGQQRTAAIRDADIRTFPICVVAFIAATDNEQREHFVRVNSAKPLPKDLIFELLPETDGVLSKQLMSKREPARLAGRLNSIATSPFVGKIRMPTCPRGIISYSAVLRMLENSFRDGALYEIETLAGEKRGEEEVLRFLCDYWSAVVETFPDAWKLQPTKSRLTHGCGILSMGYLMEEISHTVGLKAKDRTVGFRRELAKIAPTCAWTSGEWVFGDGMRRRWNDIQNTPKDIGMLTNFILAEYRRIRG